MAKLPSKRKSSGKLMGLKTSGRTQGIIQIAKSFARLNRSLIAIVSGSLKARHQYASLQNPLRACGWTGPEPRCMRSGRPCPEVGNHPNEKAKHQAYESLDSLAHSQSRRQNGLIPNKALTLLLQVGTLGQQQT